MSSIICFTDKDVAIVATDTLAVRDGRPLLFTNKAIYLPTLKLVIAGTGVGSFSSEWAEFVNSWMAVEDIEGLNEFSQEQLSTLWTKKIDGGLLLGHESSTVYHVGYSAKEDCMVAYAFRSKNSFECERLPLGCFAKPSCNIQMSGDLADFVVMMKEQRSIQESLPINERVYIGGELNAIVIQRDRVIHFKLGEFEDYSQQMDEILN